MNYFLLISGILAFFATIGHLTIGSKEFLKPVLQSDIDIIPRKVMLSIFHYITVFQVLSSVILLAFSMNETFIFSSIADVVKLIGITYAGFALVQIYIAATSGIKNGLFKLFQWVFWVLIAASALLGVY